MSHRTAFGRIAAVQEEFEKIQAHRQMTWVDQPTVVIGLEEQYCGFGAILAIDFEYLSDGDPETEVQWICDFAGAICAVYAGSFRLEVVKTNATLHSAT